MQPFPNAETELIGVVGHPIRHSLSPAFWNPALRDAGRNAAFLAFDVEPDRFETFVRGMQAAGARGLNVTLPHKLAAFDLCTERTDVAEATGAVNVLVFKDDRIVGSNTDVHGVRQAIDELGVEFERVLVLGAGGAARAVLEALKDADVTVANRTRANAEAITDQVVDWADVPRLAGDFDLVVNATSIGLDGESMPLADVPHDGRLKGVFDCVYRRGETPLVHAARASRLTASDGLSMLVHQAAEAYRLFFEDDPPVEAMRAHAFTAAGRA